MEFSSVILQHILSFLPVEAAGKIPQVRKSWNKEIGASSLTMWKFLLHRQKYLLFDEQREEEGGGIESARDRYRSHFLSNYEMINRIEWMVNAWQLLGPEADYSYFRDENEKYPYGTIIESEHIHKYRLLSLDDGTDDSIITMIAMTTVGDTLFGEKVSKVYLTCFGIHQGQGQGQGRELQKSVNVRVNPIPFPRHAKISFDEDVICCVFAPDGIAGLVAVIYRDELRSIWKDHGFSPLNDKVVDARDMQTFDMDEKFYQYCTNNPRSTILSGGLQVYLEEGGNLKDLSLSIENICACDGGLFFFYAQICKPTGVYEQYGDRRVYANDNIERVIGLFSIPQSSISCMDLVHVPWKYLNSLAKYRPKNSRFTTKIVCKAKEGEYTSTVTSTQDHEDYDIIIFDLNRQNRRVVSTSLKSEFHNSRSLVANQEWNNCNWLPIMPVAFAGQEVIIAQVLTCQIGDWGAVESMEKYKIVLSFLPLQTNPSSLGSSSSLAAPAIDLKETLKEFPSDMMGALKVYSMQVSGDHLILIYGCQEEYQDEVCESTVGLVVVHIPTRKEVYNCTRVDAEHSEYEGGPLEVPRLMIHTKNGEFIITFQHSNGMIMTSRCIRTSH
jgi:hypothetical protein